MKIKYSLKEIYPKVFLVGVENSYDLAMLFCRVQEFYESPYKEIKGKNFTITELQRIYSLRREDGCFTYPNDWSGFNIPCKTIKACYGNKIKDKNEYDNVFETIDIKIKNKLKTRTKYYVIGSDPKSKSTIEHEVAHAFYYLYPLYKREANKITDKLPKKLSDKMKKWMLKIGYNKSSLQDELQAYLSSDDTETYDEIFTTVFEKNKLKQAEIKLKELNKKYKNMI
jgi:hypothetical protein